jgi:hypothetical protein
VESGPGFFEIRYKSNTIIAIIQTSDYFATFVGIKKWIMKKIFALVAITLFVISCSSHNNKNNEPQDPASVEEDTSDVFDEDLEDADPGDEDMIQYIPVEEYPEVGKWYTILSNGAINSEGVWVDPAQSARPDIDLYFRAFAEEFPGRITNAAFDMLCRGKEPAEGCEGELDIKNGYMRALVPGAYGNEGMEMCYWRGKDGHDIVAASFIYDGAGKFDVIDRWFMALMEYDPEQRTMYPVCCTGNEPWGWWGKDGRQMLLNDMNPIRKAELPRKGKTLKLVDYEGGTVASYTWNSETNWFDVSE